jgi:hypothetical protein
VCRQQQPQHHHRVRVEARSVLQQPTSQQHALRAVSAVAKQAGHGPTSSWCMQLRRPCTAGVSGLQAITSKLVWKELSCSGPAANWDIRQPCSVPAANQDVRQHCSVPAASWDVRQPAVCVQSPQQIGTSDSTVQSPQQIGTSDSPLSVFSPRSGTWDEVGHPTAPALVGA